MAWSSTCYLELKRNQLLCVIAISDQESIFSIGIALSKQIISTNIQYMTCFIHCISIIFATKKAISIFCWEKEKCTEINFVLTGASAGFSSWKKEEKLLKVFAQKLKRVKHKMLRLVQGLKFEPTRPTFTESWTLGYKTLGCCKDLLKSRNV